MPGPPLRATSPPPATSRTKNWASTSAGENVAVRLSPPDSTSTRSTGSKSRSRSSTANRFWVTSSRIAVCGQAPVSTARIRSGASTPGRAEEAGVLVGVDVVGDHRQTQLVAEFAAQQCDQGALAGADRPSDAQPQRPMRREPVEGHPLFEISSTEQPPFGVSVSLRPLLQLRRSASRNVAGVGAAAHPVDEGLDRRSGGGRPADPTAGSKGRSFSAAAITVCTSSYATSRAVCAAVRPAAAAVAPTTTGRHQTSARPASPEGPTPQSPAAGSCAPADRSVALCVGDRTRRARPDPLLPVEP